MPQELLEREETVKKTIYHPCKPITSVFSIVEEILEFSDITGTSYTQHQSIHIAYKTSSLEIPPTTGLICFFVFEKKTFEVDALINVNMLTETKNGNAKIKNQQYEQQRSQFLHHFSNAHIPPSGQKQHTNPFSLVNIKKMDNKDKIDTYHVPGDPTAAPTNTSAQFPGLTVSNSPYSF